MYSSSSTADEWKEAGALHTYLRLSKHLYTGQLWHGGSIVLSILLVLLCMMALMFSELTDYPHRSVLQSALLLIICGHMLFIVFGEEPLARMTAIGVNYVVVAVLNIGITLCTVSLLLPRLRLFGVTTVDASVTPVDASMTPVDARFLLPLLPPVVLYLLMHIVAVRKCGIYLTAKQQCRELLFENVFKKRRADEEASCDRNIESIYDIVKMIHEQT